MRSALRPTPCFRTHRKDRRMAKAKKEGAAKRPAGVELQDDPGPLSMHGVDLEKALKAAMQVPPPPKPRRPGRKKKENPAQSSDD
jgi:hypothetical protein